MAAQEISPLSLTTFRFLNLCWCKAVHGGRSRGAVQAEAEDALDKDGNLKAKYERLLDEGGDEVGYALRGDSPVYEHAEEILKEGVAAARDEIEALCFKIEGGALILPEENFPKWAECVAKIGEIQTQTNDALNACRVDEDDPGSPLINDLLRERKKGKGKPMSMDWTPLLHPPLTVSDENGHATTEALRRSALEGIQALSETQDPAQIGRMLADLRNAETLFSDGTTRERVKTVLARAKEIKTASEQKDHGKAMIARKGGAKDKTAHMNKTADAIREKVTAQAEMNETMRGLTHTITFTSEDLRKAGDLGKALRKATAKARSEPT